MKTIRLVVLGTLLLAYVFTSCNKKYTCTCSIKNKSGSVSAADTIYIRIYNKSKAKNVCTALNFSKPEGADSLYTNCTLH